MPVNLDVLVVGVEDHEDGRHVLLQVFHHGQGHRLHEVVAAVRHHVQVGFGGPLVLLALLHHRNVALRQILSIQSLPSQM